MDKTRKNTLKIVFGTAAKIPQHMDVLRFVGVTLKISAASVHSIYKDENEQQFYIKFIDDAAFNLFTATIEEQYTFDYIDLSTTVVRLDVASSLFRYVRIFNLPPEIEDKDIAMVLGQFGVIRQHVREKYPAVYGFSVYSGVRGVHMEISKEIPANLFIGHYKARLYYEGLKNKCFYCKGEGHLKASCPKLGSLKAQQNGGQYSHVLANAIIGSASNQDVATLNMTSMPVLPNRGARNKDGGPELPPTDAEQVRPGTGAANTNAADTNATNTSAAGVNATSNSLAATSAASPSSLQDRSGSNITIQGDDNMGEGEAKGTKPYPDISSDEADESFTLVNRTKPKKPQPIKPNDDTKTPDSPIDAIDDRSRGSTRTPDKERESRSRSQRGRPGRPRK